MEAMRACTQRLPWRTMYLRPTTAGSVSSQASVAPKRCTGSSVLGRADPVAARDVELAVEDQPHRLAGLGLRRPRCRRGAAPPPWRARRWGTAAPRRRAARGRGRCGPTACAAGGRCRRPVRRCRAPRTAPAAAARRRRAPAWSAGCPAAAAATGPRTSGACSGRVTLSPRSADTGTIAATVDAGFARKGLQRVAHRLEGGLRVVQRIDLVDGEDDAGHAQQVRQQRVAARLRQQRAPARRVPVDLGDVHQHDGGVAAGGGGDHVARVLLVARRVGDDELALRRGEVAVGHVDGDALFALGLQAVGQQRQVDRLAVGTCAPACPAGRPGWRGCRTAGGRSACSCRRRRCRR